MQQKEENWDESMRSKEQIEADIHYRKEASMRRERALAYSYSHQVIKFHRSFFQSTFTCCMNLSGFVFMLLAEIEDSVEFHERPVRGIEQSRLGMELAGEVDGLEHLGKGRRGRLSRYCWSSWGHEDSASGHAGRHQASQQAVALDSEVEGGEQN